MTDELTQQYFYFTQFCVFRWFVTDLDSPLFLFIERGWFVLIEVTIAEEKRVTGKEIEIKNEQNREGKCFIFVYSFNQFSSMKEDKEEEQQRESLLSG